MKNLTAFKTKKIYVDFDGVLHRYSKGWKNGKIYDKPMEGAVEAIKLLLVNGYIPVIFTARDSKDFKLVEKWLKKWKFPKLEITNQKGTALCYLDDRAIRFVNWNDFLKLYL